MSVSTIGGFAPARLQKVLEKCCVAAGLDPEVHTVLRGHTNAVVRLAHVPVVVKIARLGTDPVEAARTVQVVRWLFDSGLPTAPLHPIEPQPVLADGHAATFWTYLPQPARDIHARDIAKPLRMLHELPLPESLPLRRRDDVAAIRASLRATTALPASTLAFLAARLEKVVEALETVSFALPECVIHGDPQHRNTLYDGEQALLCDWDTVALGQPEWDLATIEIHCRRFGHGRDSYEQFAEEYGFDITAWSGYPVMRELRELRMITTNAAKILHAPATLPEIERRIRGLRADDVQLQWQIL